MNTTIQNPDTTFIEDIYTINWSDIENKIFDYQSNLTK